MTGAPATGVPAIGALLPAAVMAGLCGFATMSVELTAVRAMAPHFGDSAYVWTNVIGVILAFEQLGQATGAAGGGAASQVASAAVMAAIAEALVATAVGIGVALPAVAAYNYLQRRIAAMLDDAETLSNLVLAYLATGEAAPQSSRVEPARAAHGSAAIDKPMNGEASRPEAA